MNKIKQRWCIKNKRDRVWACGLGWVNLGHPHVGLFSDRQKDSITALPQGGEWVLCWLVPKKAGTA